MKFILTINNMYVKRISIDSYDETTICEFSSNKEDAKEFLENDVYIIKPLIQNLLSVEIKVLHEVGGSNDQSN